MKRRNLAGLLATAALILPMAVLDASAQSAPPPAGDVTMSVEPAGMRTCDDPVTATVSWNASSAGLTQARVFVVDDTGTETLFVFAGGQGSEVTGPWVSAGTLFRLKDAAGTKVYAETTVSALPCD